MQTERGRGNKTLNCISMVVPEVVFRENRSSIRSSSFVSVAFVLYLHYTFVDYNLYCVLKYYYFVPFTY